MGPRDMTGQLLEVSPSGVQHAWVSMATARQAEPIERPPNASSAFTCGRSCLAVTEAA